MENIETLDVVQPEGFTVAPVTVDEDGNYVKGEEVLAQSEADFGAEGLVEERYEATPAE